MNPSEITMIVVVVDKGLEKEPTILAAVMPLPQVYPPAKHLQDWQRFFTCR